MEVADAHGVGVPERAQGDFGSRPGPDARQREQIAPRPLAIRSGVQLDGAEVVVVGYGELVGAPLSIMLAQDSIRGNATVTISHVRTRNLATHTRRADILVAAAGVPGLITADMVKPGAVVVDVGVHRTDDGLVGDVRFDEVKEVAGMITPVPGGVGPMTVAMLLVNTVTAAELLTEKR